MLSPVEIENKKFSKSFLGYSENSVTNFITEVVQDYEKIYRENIEFKDKIKTLEEAMKHYKTIEETLQQTLMVAQNSADGVMQNANEKAELIIRDAEMKSKQILENADRELKDITDRYEELKIFFNVAKTKMESLLKAQLEVLNQTKVE